MVPPRALAGVACVFFVHAAPNSISPPTVNVDLDVEPARRWEELGAQYATQIQKAASVVSGDPTYKSMLAAIERLIALESSSGERRWFPDEQFQELQGVSKGSNVSMVQLTAVNLFYDLTANQGGLGFHSCTSIVAQSAAGEITHGRNLDYNREFLHVMANTLAVVNFLRGGKTMYSSVSLLGMVGFNTVMKPGAFAISHDERDAGPALTNFWDIFVRRRVSTFSLLRSVADKAGSFDEAVQILQTTALPAASYFIVSGVRSGEGSLITRDRQRQRDTFKLNATAGRWYILETNYDHAGPPKWGDNRRAPAQRFLNSTGPQGFGAPEMQAVLSNTDANRSRGERPTLNDETLYSTVMRAAEPPIFEVTQRIREASAAQLLV